MADASPNTNPLPEQLPADVLRKGFRYHRHRGDVMKPTVKNDDIVTIVLVNSWKGDGIYIFDDRGSFCMYRCQRVRGEVMLMCDNKEYSTQTVPMDWFEDRVAGKVVAILNIIDNGAGFRAF